MEQTLLTQKRLDSTIDEYLQSDYVALQETLTVGEAFDDLRSREIQPNVFYLYLVDREGILKGVIPVRKLLASNPTKRLSEISISQICKLTLGMTVATALDFFVTYQFLALPVVDQKGKLIGALNIEQFADPLVEISEGRVSNDIFSVLGIKADEARLLTWKQNVRLRLPWLLVNVLGGLGCAYIAGIFTLTIQQILFATFFIPVVLVLAESIGVQTTAISVRRLRIHSFSFSHIRKLITHEFIQTSILATLLGIVVGFVVGFWQMNALFGIAVGISILTSMIAAGLLGTFFPVFFKALRIDPTVASGPLVLAVSDNLTMGIYFITLRMLMG